MKIRPIKGQNNDIPPTYQSPPHSPSLTTLGASPLAAHFRNTGNTSSAASVAIPPRASAASWRTMSSSLVFKDLERRRDGMGVRHLAKDKSDLVFKERRAYFIWREEGGRERVDCGWSADIMQDEEGAVSDEQGKRRIEEGFSES